MIGIICALDTELERFLDVIRSEFTNNIMGFNFTKGEINGIEVILTKSGIGKMDASIVTTLMIEHYNPSLIINSGIAGGFNDKLKPLDTIIGQTIGCYDIDMRLDGLEFGCFSLDKRFLKPNINNLKLNDQILGTIMSADCFQGDRMYLVKTFDKYFNSLDVDCVDMESYAIGLVCDRYGVDFLAIRTISDIIGQPSQIDSYEFFKKQASFKSFSFVMNNFF